MAWIELSKSICDIRTLNGNYVIDGESHGLWQIKYYAETVVEYEEVSTNKHNYRASVYLHVTEVIAPDVIYLTDSHMVNESNSKDTVIWGFHKNYDEKTERHYCSEGYSLLPGEPASDILYYRVEFLASDIYNCYNFDGTIDFDSETDLCVGIYARSSKSKRQGSEKFTYGEPITPGIPLPFGAQVLTADNFTDEQNPSISYKALTRRRSATISSEDACADYTNYECETIDSIQITLSFDGTTPIIPYRDLSISTTGANYTFDLTEEEREILRINAQGNDTVPIYFLTKTIRTLHYYRDGTDHSKYPPVSKEFFVAEQRNLTIIGCNPTLNPTVKDIKPETLALTGDENTFVRYESMAEYAINATASKHATIVSQSVTCGSKTISNLPYGVIDDVESGTFLFHVTDSRSMGASSSVFKNLIEYVKPTCYQKAEIEITGETGAIIKLIVSGNCFNGSFGAVNNELRLAVRYAEEYGEMGEWTTLTGTPTFNGTTYELTTTFTGLDYGKAYVFQCRAIDKLNTVQSSQYIVSMKPVFDWSDTDFNFNVPININADNLSMHNRTIIRHSETTNNTVLSSTGGHIYIRPGGTDNTSGQTIMYSTGNVDFNGKATFNNGATFAGTTNFNGSITIGGHTLSDYVIETGTEGMGSNGIWYWRKWASGKSEAWGCRNFGNMAVTTTWGNLFRSDIFTQDLPEDVFIRTPDSININIVHSNFGGWICKHEQTAPSAITTGSFIFVRPASATVTPTNIGFYVIGEWK